MCSRPKPSQHHRLLPFPAQAARARAANCSRGVHTDEGISLIEVIVAFVILLVTVLPLTYLLTSAVQSSSDARQRTAALQLADSWLETLSNTTPPTRADGTVLTGQTQTASTLINSSKTQVPQSTLAGTNFSVSAEYTTQSVNNQGQSDLCSSGQPPSPSHPSVILLQVTVSWNHGQSSLSDTTAIDYPQPGLQTEGFLAVQVYNNGQDDVSGNSAATRLTAVPVTISETSANPTFSTVTLNPDQNGCVFVQVPTGTYSVSLGQPTSGRPSTFTGYSGTPAFVNTSGSTTDSATGQSVTRGRRADGPTRRLRRRHQLDDLLRWLSRRGRRGELPGHLGTSVCGNRQRGVVGLGHLGWHRTQLVLD